MKKSDIRVNFDAAKLAAAKQYMEKKELSIQRQLEETIARLYEKYVPAAVREYIEFNAESDDAAHQKVKKAARNTAEIDTGGIGTVLPKPDDITRQSL